MLAESGHEVRVVYGGAEAVRVAQEFQPELVFLDLAMPRMNGYEAARRIRALDGGAEIFLAAVTGWGQEQDRRRSHDAGFDEQLVKPVANDVLMATVSRAKRSGSATARLS
jgi:CheY-like chemotaxis protein